MSPRVRSRSLRLSLLALAGCGVAPDPGDDTDDRESDTPADTDTDDTEPTEDTADPAIGEEERAVLALRPTVWLRVTDLTAANGAPVALWPGVGRTRDAVQPERHRQPLVRVGLASAVPVVRFDGVDDRMDLGDVGLRAAPDATFTVVAVLRTTALGGHVVGVGTSRSGVGRSESAALLVQEGGPALSAAGSTDGLFVPGPAGVLHDGAVHVLTGVVAPPVSSVLLDGRVLSTVDRAPTSLPSVLATLGASDGEGLDVARDALDFDLLEVVVVPRALGTCERWLVEETLARRHGLTVVREVLPPYLHYVAADLTGAVDEGVAEWPARPTPASPVGPLRAPTLAAQPQRVDDGGWVRFDGVDDLLFLPVNLFAPPYALRSTTVVVARTSDRDGFLVGAGPSVAEQAGRYGTGLLLHEGKVRFVARNDSLGTEAEHPTPIDDGAPHVLAAALATDDLTLFVDGVSTPALGRPEILPFSRATVGASDGAAAGVAVDPLAVDLAEVRQYRYVLDGCAMDAVRRELAAAHGAPP